MPVVQDRPTAPTQLEESDRSGWVSLPLVFAPEADTLLEELAAESGGDKVETIRLAIGLLKLARDARAEGLKLGAVRPDQELDTEFIEF